VGVGVGIAVAVGVGAGVLVGIGVDVSVGMGVALSALLVRVNVVVKGSLVVVRGSFSTAKADGVSSSASRALKATSRSAKMSTIIRSTRDTLHIASCFTVTPAYFHQPLQDISRRGNPSPLHKRRVYSLASIIEEFGQQEKSDEVVIWLRYSYDGRGRKR